MTRWLIRSLALSLAICAARASAQGAGPPAPRYAAALEQELARMALGARCASEPNARHHCSFPLPGGTGLTVHAVYSDETDSVYVYVERFAVVPSDSPRAAPVLRRLMELNWELLIGKFEWSARTGEVRLGAVLNTDSNFDLRALRSVVRALSAITVKHRAEIRELLAD